MPRLLAAPLSWFNLLVVLSLTLAPAVPAVAGAEQPVASASQAATQAEAFTPQPQQPVRIASASDQRRDAASTRGGLYDSAGGRRPPASRGSNPKPHALACADAHTRSVPLSAARHSRARSAPAEAAGWSPAAYPTRAAKATPLAGPAGDQDGVAHMSMAPALFDDAFRTFEPFPVEVYGYDHDYAPVENCCVEFDYSFGVELIPDVDWQVTAIQFPIGKEDPDGGSGASLFGRIYEAPADWENNTGPGALLWESELQPQDLPAWDWNMGGDGGLPWAPTFEFTGTVVLRQGEHYLFLLESDDYADGNGYGYGWLGHWGWCSSPSECIPIYNPPDWAPLSVRECDQPYSEYGCFGSAERYCPYAPFAIQGSEYQAQSQPPLPDESGRNSCPPSGPLPGDERPCDLTAFSSNVVDLVGDPINTLTGGIDYTVVDLSLPALGGRLAFQRSYSSLATTAYTTTLGTGWTHNHDTRLILPGAPGGVAGQARFKAHSTNEYIFYEEEDGSYTAYTGVLARLERTTAPAGFRITAPDQSTYVFDEDGALLRWDDAQQHTWSYSYDGGGKLSSVADESGLRYLEFGYETGGRLAWVRDPISRSVSFTYSTNGDLASVTDAGGYAWSYGYDGTSHRLSEIVDPLGETVARTEFEAQGRAVRQFDALGTKTLEIGYLSDGVRVITDTVGQVRRAVYNERRVLASLAVGEEQTQTSYDANFRPTAVTDARGNATETEWDANGTNLLRRVDAEERVTELSYDLLNHLTRQTDALGHSTILTYAGSLLTASQDALGHTTTYTYTAPGLLASQTDPLGRTTHYTYDASGQRASVTDPAGLTASYEYDAVGRPVTTTLPGGLVELRSYDGLDHLLAVTKNYTTTSSLQNYLNEYNLRTEYGYDAVGRRIAITDTLGHVTRNFYDEAGRLLHKIENYQAGRPQNDEGQYNRITAYGYDLLGNQVRITDTLGIVTATEYDALRRPIRITANYRPGEPADAETNVVQETEYDGNGNVVRSTDALGRVTFTEYDALNRPVDVTANYVDGVFDPDHPDEDVTTTTAYDELGRVSQRTDAAGNVTSYAYDATGRLTETTNAAGGTATTEYDAAGQAVLETDAAGHVTVYGYDHAGRVETVTDALDGVTTTVYDAFGRREATIDALGNERATPTLPPAACWRWPMRRAA